MNDFWNQFKNIIVTVVLIFLAFLIYTKVFGPIPFYINSVNTTKTDLFASSGAGEATAVPDQATISVGVTKSANTVKEAQTQVNTVTEKLIADLKKLGIKDNDIKTTDYNVNPNFQPGEVQPMMMPIRGGQNGYQVTQNIDVKIKPIELTNKVIDTATADGANLVNGANFTFSDDLEKSLVQKATKMAVDDAREKANNLADAAGVHLGKIVNVVSNTNGPIMPMMAQSSGKANDQETTPPTNVTPGQSTVNISVTIYYETF